MATKIVDGVDFGVIGFNLNEGKHLGEFGGTWHKHPDFKCQPDAVSFESAATLLKWGINKVPTFTPDGKATGGFALQDTDSNILYPFVGDDYKVVSNQQLLEAVSRLMAADEDLQIESVMSLDGRRIVAFNVIFGKMAIDGDPSDTVMRFTIMNFNGGQSLKFLTHFVRMMCWNTASLALNTASKIFHVRHLGEMESKITVATDKLSDLRAEARSAAEKLGKLSSVKIDTTAAEKFLLGHFDVEKNDTSRTGVRRNNLVNEAMQIFLTKDDLQLMDMTALRLWNSVTDFHDHHTEKRGGADAGTIYLDSVIGGESDRKDEFLKRMMALV